MFEEIVKRYERFSDAIVYKMNYTTSAEEGTDIDLELSCADATQEYKRFRVTFSFLKVSSFIFDETGYMASTWITSALLKKEGEIITFDFFPEETEAGVLEENPRPRFQIKCAAVKYEVLKEVIVPKD